MDAEVDIMYLMDAEADIMYLMDAEVDIMYLIIGRLQQMNMCCRPSPPLAPQPVMQITKKRKLSWYRHRPRNLVLS